MPDCTPLPMLARIVTPRLWLEPADESRLSVLAGGGYEPVFETPVADGMEAFAGEVVWSLRRLRQATPAERPWWIPFLFLETGEGMLVGVGGLKGPPDTGTVEIGYSVAGSVRGRGYATEAALAMARHAFAHPDVRRVRAHTLVTNGASARVLEKCGFLREGEPRRAQSGLTQRWELPKTPAHD